jgi:hypothetical protein
MGASPQDIINKQIVDDCDFGVAVFWSRLGSPTQNHESGSVEEIERLLAKGANVMVYFCDAPIAEDALQDEQYGRLQALKRSFRERGLLAKYSTVDELRGVLPLHVNGVVNEILIQLRASGQPIPSQGTASAPMPDIRVIVKSGIFVKRDGTHPGIIVEIQNHSPRDFFFSSLCFLREDGIQLFFQRDYATGEFLVPRKIEPGNGLTVIADPKELAKGLEGKNPTVVEVKDKIDRRFSSRQGDLATALADALDFGCK